MLLTTLWLTQDVCVVCVCVGAYVCACVHTPQEVLCCFCPSLEVKWLEAGPAVEADAN